VSRYRVVSEDTELPPGLYFFTVPEHPIEGGSLLLFSIGDRCGENLIVGRWIPDVAGYDWIVQPGRLIRITRDIILWIIGRVVPLIDFPCLN